ncbi:MAG: restriction endonuclease subunit S [Bacteroidales bacterium]
MMKKNILNTPNSWSNAKFPLLFDKISITNKKVKQKDYEISGNYPIIDQGEKFIGGYTNDKSKLIINKNKIIVFGDHTKNVKLINRDFAPGADGIKVLKTISAIEVELYKLFIEVAACKIPSKGYSRHFQYLEKFKFPLPPLPEQHEIVRRLESQFSRLDDATEKLKTARQQLKTYRQAVLKQAFDGKLTEAWREQQSDLEPAETLLEKIKAERQNRYEQELKTWKQAVKTWEKAGKTGKKTQKPQKPKTVPELTEEERKDLPALPKGWMWVKHQNFSEINKKPDFFKIYDELDVSFLKMAKVEELSGKIHLDETRNFGDVKKGYTPFVNNDLIFAKITPCMENGKFAVVNKLKNNIGFGSTEFHVSRFLTQFSSPNFFFYYFIQSRFRRLAQRNMTGSAGQLRVPTNYFRKVPLPMCSLKEQQQIVHEIEKRFSVAEKLEKSIEDSLQKAEALRQSILKKAFEGELTRQWREENPELISGENSAEKLLERIKEEKEKMNKKHYEI